MTSKLTIRDAQQSDMAKIAEFHAKMAPGYDLPEAFSPLFFVFKKVEDENGNLVAAATVKLVGEAYLFVNSEISALKRAKSVKMLNEECAKAAGAAGLEDVSCWIPPKIAECFSKVIEKLGWRKSPWSNWSMELK